MECHHNFKGSICVVCNPCCCRGGMLQCIPHTGHAGRNSMYGMLGQRLGNVAAQLLRKGVTAGDRASLIAITNPSPTNHQPILIAITNQLVGFNKYASWFLYQGNAPAVSRLPCQMNRDQRTPVPARLVACCPSPSSQPLSDCRP